MSKGTPPAKSGKEAKLWLAAGTFGRDLLEPDLGDCMVALPGQFFYSTQIPVCLSFIGKKEPARKIRAISEPKLALAA